MALSFPPCICVSQIFSEDFGQRVSEFPSIIPLLLAGMLEYREGGPRDLWKIVTAPILSLRSSLRPSFFFYCAGGVICEQALRKVHSQETCRETEPLQRIFTLLFSWLQHGY